MSRVVRPTSFGTPAVLRVVDQPVPRAAAGGVVVQVHAAGVNPIDWKLYSGAFHDVDADHADAAGTAAAMPSLGLECAGVVTEVGAGVSRCEVGDEVVVYPVTAAYADHVAVPEASILPKPAGLDWAEAGSLMLAGTTAFHALRAAGVTADDTVLVHGGSGGVGLMVVQLAAATGATVIATASEQNHDLLRRLGVLPVTYGAGLLDRVQETAPAGVSAALDLVGTREALEVSVKLVDDRSRIASIAGGPDHGEAGIKMLGYGPGQDAGVEVRTAARGQLLEGAGSGRLRVIVARTYPLADAASAHEAGISGHAAGKLALIP